MKSKGILLTGVLLLATTTGFAAEIVKGLGNLTTKEIPVEDFDDVELIGTVEFNYEQTEGAPSLTVTIDENLISFLKIGTKDRKLTVGLMKGVTIEPTKYTIKANSKWLKAVKVTSTGGFYANSPLSGSVLEVKGSGGGLVQLKKEVKVGKLDIVSSGSGNVVVDQMAGDEMECKVSGSGSVTVKGTTPKAVYAISGSGIVNAFDCPAPEVECKITGSGVAKIHATENLKANIIGSGSIVYKGNTNVTQKVIGSGKVEALK